MSGAPVTAGGAFTGTSIVIVRVIWPEPLGFGTVPVPVRCHFAFVIPSTLIVEPPGQLTPAGQSSTPDQVMQVELLVQAADEVGDCWPVPPFGATGAQSVAIVVSEVVLSNGWPLES